MSFDFQIVIASVTTAAALGAEHLLMWRPTWRLNPPASYCVGAGTFGGIYSLWVRVTGCTDPVMGFWAILISGGLAVCVAYWLRSTFDCLYKQGMRAGMIAAMPLHKMRDDETPFHDA